LVPLKDIAPPPAPPDGAAIAALEQRISRAVNNAKYYPAMARQTHREGRVAISFNYRDGTVADIALQQSSQSPMLDNAAIAAVRLAHYPSPPADLNGYRLRLTVWVQFSLVALE
jgi:protein TonB